MRIALAMIVKGTDEEAQNLIRSLQFSSRYVDGIFITITHQPGEERNKNVEEAATLYNAEISDFEWCNDFAKARNFNFSQVPTDYDYILWCDADDAFRSLEKLRETVAAHPADAYSMFYMYAFDSEKNPVVVHHKTRLVRNDGCVSWAGRIHEDFKENRQLVTFHIDGIEVIHLSNDERFNLAKDRNLEIARLTVQDSPDDPRTRYNLGTALYAAGQFEEAILEFDIFLRTSKSDDEKYIVRLRRAETFWSLQKPAKAIEEAQYAVGIRPNFPDAYFILASFHNELNQLQQSAELFLTGLTKPRPYYKIIVYNPRDYDYVPMMKLAQVYYKLARPDLALPLLKGCSKIYPNDKALKTTIRKITKEVKKFEELLVHLKKLSKIEDNEVLRAELDKIPAEFRSHPGICNLRNIRLVKTESTGKDLIIYCGFTEEQWSPDTIKEKGIGGSEEAVLHLSNRFAEAGWNVSVYNNCGHEVKTFDKVTYLPFWMWNYRDKQDAIIFWRTPIYCDYEINSPKIYLDMHDVIPAAEFTESRLKKITKVFVKSQFQRSIFPNIPDTQIEVIPNGIDPTRFISVWCELCGKTGNIGDKYYDCEKCGGRIVERDPLLVINTSAPDRSISVLTKMWPKVLEAVPKAKLKWAYGFGTFDVGYRDDAKVMAWKKDLIDLMKLNHVEVLGRISHDEVARLYLTANIWAYPTGFAEIDCISLTKAMAAGALPVTTDFAALKEKTGHGGYFYPSSLTSETWCAPYQFDFAATENIEDMTSKIIELLQNPPPEEERNAMRRWAKDNYSWDNIANKWLSIIN